LQPIVDYLVTGKRGTEVTLVVEGATGGNSRTAPSTLEPFNPRSN
jgi:hypothetical protein